MTRKSRLPDHIEPDLSILFVGINPGLRSALVGHHFAGPSNRFWKLLYESRLVTEPLTAKEDKRLPEWKLGLTNIIGRSSRGIDTLEAEEYRRGVTALTRKIRRYRPRIVALLGVTIYRMVFGLDQRMSPRVALGTTARDIAGVPIFLLPNPSGRNAHYSYEEMLVAFQSLQQLAEHAPVALDGLDTRSHSRCQG
ncbi:MAG: mismatch-specific DNA-glycosylase [Nitrospira sp.]|nr:mismatch-specific DNA-glycosylase [Nitrospira sp.]